MITLGHGPERVVRFSAGSSAKTSETGAGDPAGAQVADQRGFVDDIAACDIDEERGGFHRGDDVLARSCERVSAVRREPAPPGSRQAPRPLFSLERGNTRSNPGISGPGVAHARRSSCRNARQRARQRFRRSVRRRRLPRSFSWSMGCGPALPLGLRLIAQHLGPGGATAQSCLTIASSDICGPWMPRAFGHDHVPWAVS